MAPNKSVTVLVIEDSTEDFEIIKRAFREEGMDIALSHCTSGDDGLEYLEQMGDYSHATKPSAILLDLGLPGMSGKEFLKIIKSERKFQDLPVIVFTGSKSQGEIDDCTKLGAISVLEKPINYFGFKDVVKQITKKIRALT